MAARYDGHLPLVELGAADVARVSRHHCRPETFQASKAPTGKEANGFEAAEFLSPKKDWTSTTVEHLTQYTLSLGHALLEAAEAKWPSLWMARLLTPGMAITHSESGAAFLVANVSQ
eukprot:11767528-Alexandrium_andersonii.AAC.1